MRFHLFFLFFISHTVSYSQEKLEDKIYYGQHYFPYKNAIKGKLGEAQIHIIKFKQDYAELYTFQRFVTPDNENSKLTPIGKIKSKQKNYTLNNNDLKLEIPIYQILTLKNDTLQAYVNNDYKTKNQADTYVEITQEELDSILSSESFNKK